MKTSAFESLSSDPRLLRATAFGMVHGVDDSSVSGTLFWKGIPFAAAPVGELRWKAPRDPSPWRPLLVTHHFGPAPMQIGRIYGPGNNNTYDESIAATLGSAVGSEDCLSLNLWRPATGETELPVIFYIFGGSNVSGYSADPLYDGAKLARAANAVVVTANYRLGILGWLLSSYLQSGSDTLDDSGNFGTLDTIKALQFVRQNIRSFGGNPDKVTLMGQSAGAVNVYALMTSPLVVHAPQPLFHRAVPLSGGISLASNLPPGCIPTLNPAATARAQASALLTQLLIIDGLASDEASAAAYLATRSREQIAAYMRSQDAAALFHVVMTTLSAKGLAASGPIPEGQVLPLDPIAAIQAGHYTKVPVLAGNTRDEAKLFPAHLALSPALGGVPGLLVTDAERFSAMYHFDPDRADSAATAAHYIHPGYLPCAAPTTGYNARTDRLKRILFLPSRDCVLDALKSRQAEVWYYQFDWAREVAPWNEIYGAAHAFDLPFLFGNFDNVLFGKVIGGSANRAGRMTLSALMMSFLAAFAHRGDPNNMSLHATWPAWPQQLRLDATLETAQMRVEATEA
jgi:para-nitrobenzyl esterase